MPKTLIGKNNYLFLINDSSNSLEVHTNPIINETNIYQFNRYDEYIINKNILFVVFPDKEVICKDFLPFNLEVIYRPGLTAYKKYFGTKLIDGTEVLDNTDYYKTDSHINTKGGYKIFKLFISKLEEEFNVTIDNLKSLEIYTTYVSNLGELQEGIGDLTWNSNKGDLVLTDISDIYFNIKPYIKFYCNVYLQDNNSYKFLDIELNDVSSKYYNKIITWDIINSNYLYKLNSIYIINKRVIIFYDSFLISTLNLYKDIFREVFLIKNILTNDIINKVNPDFIIECRVERFLF